MNSLELNFESLQIKKWNIPTDRSEKGDEKNGVICLVIMFTLTVKVFKISKMANFECFLLISQFGRYIKVDLENLIEFLQEMVWLLGFGLKGS